MTTEARLDLEQRAREKADAIVAAWNERDHATSEKLSDRLTAVLLEHARELEALQRERDEVRDSVGEQFLQWRGVQGKSCKNCGGAGSYSYPDTSTWHRGMGGQSFTMDVCDKCWGSGDSERPWTNLRHLNTKLRRALKWDWKEIARRFARRAFNHRSNYREMVRENAKTRTERDTALADLAAAQAKLDALADKLKSANSIGSMFTMGTVRATEALMVAEQQRDAAITRAETAERDLAAARAKLEPAREAFTRLLAMAQKPMKSWDAGRCVEAERVEEIAAEALEALA